MVPPFTVASFAMKTHQIPQILPSPAMQIKETTAKMTLLNKDVLEQLQLFTWKDFVIMP